MVLRSLKLILNAFLIVTFLFGQFSCAERKMDRYYSLITVENNMIPSKFRSYEGTLVIVSNNYKVLESVKQLAYTYYGGELYFSKAVAWEFDKSKDSMDVNKYRFVISICRR